MTASTHAGNPPQAFTSLETLDPWRSGFLPDGYPIEAMCIKDIARSDYRRAGEDADARWRQALGEAHWTYLGMVKQANADYERDRLAAEAKWSEAMARIAELEAASKEPTQ
jgi:hypothetical protein